MSEVKRWYIGVYNGEAQARVCAPHPHEFIRDTDGETFVIAEQFDACEARNRALQQRLTAADERADVLETALKKISARCVAYIEAEREMPEPSVEVCQMIASAALRPAESAKDEHVCPGCGSKGWMANCKECVPY
ncbi:MULTISPECIES: hypothetical protein [Pseudomonas]|uniref:Uncharacterized protein n=1 Tax=Pseudomonas rhodesiae TaxID=76760 RepID=A0A8I1E6G0_9PSED|nr:MULTISPECIES: hypothetical protein [Pseudomonas]MBI6605228.1 hypothetical protein [Pseudomonas sp. S4_EA_1b]MBI6626500.1 hypothetical protein [Pseudomonas rhodesiae]